jgi:hypothetical protein
VAFDVFDDRDQVLLGCPLCIACLNTSRAASHSHIGTPSSSRCATREVDILYQHVHFGDVVELQVIFPPMRRRHPYRLSTVAGWSTETPAEP